MDGYDDEIFGPVLGVTRVGHVRRGVRLVNDNPYGNGTAIFTRDGGVARQFQFDVQAGMVGINVPIPVPVAYYSFGGWKARSSATAHLRARRGSTSTRAARSSRRAGPIRPRRRSTSASRRRADWSGTASPMLYIFAIGFSSRLGGLAACVAIAGAAAPSAAKRPRLSAVAQRLTPARLTQAADAFWSVNDRARAARAGDSSPRARS